MDSKTRETVRQRAGNACEYCRIPQEATPFITFHVEHITARQHGGGDDLDDLALACDRCNAYKGTNLTSIDPKTGNIVPLFHARRDAWEQHFAMRLGEVVGLSPSGRATVRLLRMNEHRRIELRLEWLAETDD